MRKGSMILAGCVLMNALVFGRTEKAPPILKGPYLGQTPPGNKPEGFLPSIFGNTHTSPVFAPDGNRVYWSEHDSLHVMEQVQGEWTAPHHLKFFETSANEDVPFLSRDGLRLYFYASFKAGEKRHQRGIWYVDRVGDTWTEPRSVGSEINSLFGHWQFSVSDRGTIYFPSAEGILASRLIQGTYETPVTVVKGVAAFPFISPDEDYLIFGATSGSEPLETGNISLHIRYRKKDGSWTESIDLTRKLGLETGFLCPIVSPDGKYMFFMGPISWIDAGFIEELRPKE